MSVEAMTKTLGKVSETVKGCGNFNKNYDFCNQNCPLYDFCDIVEVSQDASRVVK